MNFSALKENLPVMLQFICQETKAAGFDEATQAKIELALEEALVNIIKHGYSNHSGEIEINCRLTSDGLCIVLKDRGVPYNPLANVRKLDPSTPLEFKTVGGYGLHLILSIMDRVDYCHQEGCNILTLLHRK